MSDTMRERITRVIHQSKDDPWASSEDIANAVLDALREPTEDMLAAMTRYDWESKTDPSWLDCWHVMIDAAKENK